ncbi:MAG: exonuclease SbcCD subunit D [Thermoplasmataceae archaeon]
MIRFLHMSDTHLGSRIYMSDDREQDFYDSFDEAMDIAIKERVDFIVHSGDLFDTWSPSNYALSKFRDSALRMKEAGIPMFLIMGDHDRPKRTDYPAAEIFNFLGIRLLGKEGLEHVVHETGNDQVLIAGISNMKGFRRNALIEEYHKADEISGASTNSILISHQAITGYLYDEACEARPEDLPVNFSYLAFGHVHDWALKQNQRPVFSYAGSTELKSTREIPAFIKNGKSVNIVSLEDGIATVERRKLTSVRFQYTIEANPADYQEEIDRAIEKYSSRFGNKKPVFSLRIVGNTDRDRVREKLKDYHGIIFRPPEFISEKVEVESRPGMENIDDYINAYFSNDPELAEIAKQYYKIARSDRDAALNFLMQKLGVSDQ